LQNKTNRSSKLSKSIGYTRVSTNEQAEEGISLEAQQERLHAYCILRGLELVQIVSDPGVSAGKPLVKREGGNYLLEQLAMGTVQHVIALKLDRLRVKRVVLPSISVLITLKLRKELLLS